MKKINLVIIISSIILFSCNRKPENFNRNLSTEQKIAIQNIPSIPGEVGLNNLKTSCYSCHNPNSVSHDNMLAPPLAGIKYKYKKLYPTEELFIAQMSDFLDNPTIENSVMKGPVKRFGLMPKTTLTKIQIQELVKFIYNEELEVPKWFPEHFEEQHNIKWGDKDK